MRAVRHIVNLIQCITIKDLELICMAGTTNVYTINNMHCIYYKTTKNNHTRTHTNTYKQDTTHTYQQHTRVHTCTRVLAYKFIILKY